jgi:formamidopyrimidine-DNA glycosylase
VPELPEVETIRRGLQRLEGTTLADVDVRERRLRRRIDVAALQALCGRRIARLGRRAKYLLFEAERGGGMIVHLGMSGRLFLVAPGSPPQPHEHVSWWFERDGESVELRFQDPRRFGLVAARRHGSVSDHPLFAGLGPEPFDAAFSPGYAYRATRGSRRPVKNALMDARFVAGVGNIYASEALWRAAINPKTRAGRISRRRWQRLLEAVVEVLQDAIAEGGTTLNDFRSATGDPGYFQIALRAYDREGASCARCGGTIRRIVQVGRSTYYCPGCQV